MGRTAIAPVVVVHGGAGDVPEASRAAHAEGCRVAAAEGLRVLLETGSALEAAVRAVEVLEDDPKYNAGTGACLTEAGTIELDASVMEGTTMRGGAVCALPPFHNPIRIARAVLEEGRHVLYASEGASRFAIAHGFGPADPDTMITEKARHRLAAVLAGRAERGWAGGTVGAVACDREGRVAAATSTGGMVGKRVGRVGDSPILGAGTFADDESGAASATGQGEAIHRFGLTRYVCDLLRAGLTAQQAADVSIARFGARVSGSGGLIVVDARGEVGIARNTATMSFGVAREGDDARAGH
ncbi:isoaspartyl peptidase/L-asparaginase family protein [Sandaracinus amylolyticus]|uniref:isoaspartyl peptidase/L-asparaginase family protein n=1 Tax=Sandaracinus amylolyticus TaxID=927083 RepID=UPI001F2D7C22|nr:isoaspartyl peptidase/L-asparaginase [Sandaracinus amylolyticus]UJR81712.1 Isoaspartyl dipeptidase [Sandaracinus amylolyticus]